MRVKEIRASLPRLLQFEGGKLPRISVFNFFQELGGGFDEHFSRARFYAGVGDLIAAFREGLSRRDIAGPIIANRNDYRVLECGGLLDGQAKFNEYLAGQAD